ncbi:MAG: hypothetical protein GYB21_15975, partial [Oceanospirillales bacterium]|nr:hypothetical protein [Oceanospirillales bacterium]
MERAQAQTPSRLFDRMRRLFLPKTAMARTPIGSGDIPLQELSLALAESTDLLTELPVLLQPLENALNLEGESRLLLALTLPGRAEASLIQTPRAQLPVGLPAFLRYQLSHAFGELERNHPLLISLPGSPLKLHLHALPVSGLDTALILL